MVKHPLHDTTCCQTGLTTGYMFVYTIEPVVKPHWQLAVSCIQLVVKPVVQPSLTTDWTNSGCSFNTAERTVAARSMRLSNRCDNRLDVCLHDTAGCQTGCTICLTTGCIV